MIKDILARGYSFAYTTLCAADFGIPTSRSRLILIAAAPGNNLPHWPVATGEIVTLQDAIRDLTWRKPRPTRDKAGKVFPRMNAYCNKPSLRPRPSDYARSLGALKSSIVSHHRTGFKPSMDNWDEDRTLPKWDEPLNSMRLPPFAICVGINFHVCFPSYTN